MLSLAFECAGQGLSAALAAEGKLIGTTAQQMDRGQPAALLPALHDLLASHGVSGSDLQRIGCTVGPGGFTGIRLGISAGLGLARATGAGFFGFNAFDVYALSAPSRAKLAIAIESRRAEIFVRVYDETGEQLALKDAILTPEAVNESAFFEHIVGSAASKLLQTAKNTEPDMAFLACLLSESDENSPVLQKTQGRATPIYLRAPEIGGKTAP